MKQLEKNHVYWLYGVLGCALVLRLGFGFLLTGLTQASDELHWDGLGRAFERLGVMHPDTGVYRPPLYGLMLASVYHVFGHSIEAIRILQALIGTTTCLLVYYLGAMIGSRLTGLLAAGLSAVYPMFIFFTGVLMTETLLVFLTMACVIAYLKFENQPTNGRAILLGISVGLSALCKPVLALWAPVVLFLWWYRSDLTLNKKGILIGLVVASIGVLVLPWTWRNYMLSGELIPISTNVGINLLIGWHPRSMGIYEKGLDYFGMYQNLTGTLNFVVGDQQMFQVVAHWFVEDPLRFVFLSFAKMFWLWVPWVLDTSLAIKMVSLFSSGPLIFLGLWGIIKLRQTEVRWVLGLFVVSVSILHVIFFAHTRFRLPIDAVLCVTAAWLMTSHSCSKRGCDGN